MTDTVAAYTALTAKLGYGLHSARALLDAGATWPMLHALADLDLIRIVRWDDVPGTDRTMPIYRLMFA